MNEEVTIALAGWRHFVVGGGSPIGACEEVGAVEERVQ